MPSLEILDIGRNKIEALPTDPGTLVNLRVSPFSLLLFSNVLMRDYRSFRYPKTE